MNVDPARPLRTAVPIAVLVVGLALLPVMWNVAVATVPTVGALIAATIAYLGVLLLAVLVLAKRPATGGDTA